MCLCRLPDVPRQKAQDNLCGGEMRLTRIKASKKRHALASTASVVIMRQTAFSPSAA